MSELIRIKNIDQYTQEYVNGELVLTLKKTASASASTTVNDNPVLKLNLNDKHLKLLPDNLPTTLTHLMCCNTQLISLPDTLPAMLTHLWCAYNQLTSLPDKLPDTLTHLWCYDNKLTSLPENLPDSLNELWCDNNQLTLLPDLPNSLQYIRLENNPLKGNYPEIFNFKSTQAIHLITYVNKRNREMRADDATAQLTAIKQLIAKFEKTTTS